MSLYTDQATTQQQHTHTQLQQKPTYNFPLDLWKNFIYCEEKIFRYFELEEGGECCLMIVITRLQVCRRQSHVLLAPLLGQVESPRQHTHWRLDNITDK